MPIFLSGITLFKLYGEFHTKIQEYYQNSDEPSSIPISPRDEMYVFISVIIQCNNEANKESKLDFDDYTMNSSIIYRFIHSTYNHVIRTQFEYFVDNTGSDKEFMTQIKYVEIQQLSEIITRNKYQFVNYDIKKSIKIMFGILKNKKIVSRKITFDYGIPQNIHFNFEDVGNGYIVVTSPDLPGFITQTKKNNKKLPEILSDAILYYFDVPNNKGDLLPGKFELGNMVYKFNPGEQTT